MKMKSTILILAGLSLSHCTLLSNSVGEKLKTSILRQHPCLKTDEFAEDSRQKWHNFEIIFLSINNGPEPSPNLIGISHDNNICWLIDWQTMVMCPYDKMDGDISQFIKGQINKMLRFINSYDFGIASIEIIDAIAKYGCMNGVVVKTKKDLDTYVFHPGVIKKAKSLLDQDDYGTASVLIRSYKYGLLHVFFGHTQGKLTVHKIDRIVPWPNH